MSDPKRRFVVQRGGQQMYTGDREEDDVDALMGQMSEAISLEERARAMGAAVAPKANQYEYKTVEDQLLADRLQKLKGSARATLVADDDLEERVSALLGKPDAVPGRQAEDNRVKGPPPGCTAEEAAMWLEFGLDDVSLTPETLHAEEKGGDAALAVPLADDLTILPGTPQGRDKEKDVAARLCLADDLTLLPNTTQSATKDGDMDVAAALRMADDLTLLPKETVEDGEEGEDLDAVIRGVLAADE